MRKFLNLFILFAVMFGFIGGISAATKLHSDFPDTITASKGTMYQVGQAKVWKKEYSGGSFSGKAICSTFKRTVPPTGTKCSLTDWNSNATENKKLASGIAAIIKKARDLSTDVDGINWTNYLYAEMAINQFLYENNGQQADNNMAAEVSKSNWSAITSASAYQQMMAAASAAYKNYGNAKIILSDNTIDVTYDADKNVTSATASVKAVCKDHNGNNIKCNLTTKNLKYGSQSKTLTVGQNDTNATVLTADVTDWARSTARDSELSVTFDVETSPYQYNVSEQYDCGSYQKLAPNIIRTTSEPVKNSIPASVTISGSTCKIIVKKTDGTQSLNGAKFELYNSDNTKIKTFTVNGQITISGLALGTYKLVETQAPEGYVIQNGGVTNNIELNDSNCQTGNTVTVQNTKQTGQLTINKVDEAGNNIAGAKIKVYRVVKNNEGIYVPEYVKFGDSYAFESGETPKVVENLIVGETYTVQEEEAPSDAYVMKKATATIVIQAGNNTVTLENSLSSFKVSKQDINSSKEIPGAHLEIFYENETSTGWSWVSTDKPQEITGLAYGNYILVETTAPQGYTVAESIPFTIENGKLKDRDANTLVMKDATIVDVPDTFTMQNIIAMISGLVLVGLGTGVLFYETKKKKKA